LSKCLSVPFETEPNRSQESCFVHRLAEQSDRPERHAACRHRRITMARDEHDRQIATLGAERLLQIEASLSWHSHVDQQARWPTHVLKLEKLSRRRAELDAISGRSNEPLECTAHRGVIVDDVNSSRYHTRVSASGRLMRNVAPTLTLESAHMRPPWASTIERAMERPIPMAVGFVVKKGSNTAASV
jgi:hypothetical protein